MRRFLLISLICVAGSASMFAATDEGLLALVPGDAKIVTFVDANQARNSQFGQYLLKQTQANDQHFEEFVQETGFDPRRDLQSFMFESSGPTSDGTHGQWALLARGTFDQDRIQTLARQKGATVQTYQGVNILVGKGDHQQTAFAFPEIGLAVVGDLAAVRKILANNGTPTSLDPALNAEIEKASANNDAWFASSLGGSFLGNQIKGETKDAPPQAVQALQSILESSGGIRFGSTIDLTFDALTRSPQDATSLADVVRFVASLLQMQRQKDPRAAILAKALDNMDLTTTADRLHLGIAIPEQSLEQLAQLGPPNSGTAVHPRAHAQ
ncbi:MAG: hypothetical protein JO138_04205 [Acidobacteriaceae bacterium]|nr:hypothetical protein [Acidobacteriaceae bacterium]